VSRVGAWIIVLWCLVAIGAPWVAVHPPDAQHREFVFAPPMALHVRDAQGTWRAPFYYALSPNPTTPRAFVESRNTLVAPSWFAGRIVTPDAGRPWFPLGTDSLGRDVWSRLVYGARLSIGVALCSTLGALLLGTLVGALAGASAGWLDGVLMRLTELVLVLPVLYVVLALRAALPLVLAPPLLFTLLIVVLSIAGAPPVARGVRGILAAERVRDYAIAARALGAGRTRIVVRHLLPAARGFLVTQALVLAPAFILAEATLSYVGLGFNPPAASWGSMLQEATNVRAMADFPWVLAPAVAIVFVVFGLTLASEPRQDRSTYGMQSRV
jgi:peptide/nickel transport system permease protein